MIANQGNIEQMEQPGLPASVVDVPPSKLRELLSSRKFWAALIGLGMIILKTFRPDFPVSEDQLTRLVYLVIAYILGTAIENSGSGANPSGSGANPGARSRNTGA